MVFLLFTLISLTPTSRAEAPLPAGTCDAILYGVEPLQLTAYTRWLVDDGVIRPTDQLARLVADRRRVRDRDFTDDLTDLLGKPGKTLTHMKRMVPFSRQLGELMHGYQGLDIRCGKITGELSRDHDFVKAMIARSEAVLNDVYDYLEEHPGRDTDWVMDHLRRAYQAIADFKTHCHENPPPAAKYGLSEKLRRIFAP